MHLSVIQDYLPKSISLSTKKINGVYLLDKVGYRMTFQSEPYGIILADSDMYSLVGRIIQIDRFQVFALGQSETFMQAFSMT